MWAELIAPVCKIWGGRSKKLIYLLTLTYLCMLHKCSVQPVAIAAHPEKKICMYIFNFDILCGPPLSKVCPFFLRRLPVFNKFNSILFIQSNNYHMEEGSYPRTDGRCTRTQLDKQKNLLIKLYSSSRQIIANPRILIVESRNEPWHTLQRAVWT